MTASVVGAQVCDFTCLPQRNSSTEIPFWSSVHESALPKGEKKKNSCLDLKLKKKKLSILLFHVITIIFLVFKKQSLSRLDTFKNTVFLHPRTCFCQPPPRCIHSSLTISTASRQLSPCTPCIYMNVHAHNIPIYYSLLKWNGTSELVIRKCKGQAWLCRCRTRSTQIFLHDSAK